MSLMQLWRCLYAVKKKNDSNDMVPFRESKLTHILMPTLYRVGTAGAAMIACVNPQSADYDETISVLGNASLACEINVKEIVPVKEAPRPVSRKLGARVSSVVLSRSSVSSATSVSVASKTSSVETSDTDTRKRKASASDIPATDATDFTVDEDSQSAVKAASVNYDMIDELNREIRALKSANKKLESGQLDREQEIRVEVCNEMAAYSQSLLDQIQELQDEIFDLKAAGSDNRKSVKKVKREQRSLEHEEALKNLADSEEEMERQKKYYDSEIKSLKQQIRASKIEIADWKVLAEQNAVVDENGVSSTSGMKRKPLGTISPNVSPAPESGEGAGVPKAKKDKRSTSPYRETDGSGLPGIAPPVSPKMVGSGPFFTRTMRSTTVRI